MSGFLNRDLLKFNLSPKLKVIGTYHALNREDKECLEKEIDQSDFVALEYDTIRLDNLSLKLILSFRRRSKAVDEALFTGPLNALYLIGFSALNKRNIKKANSPAKIMAHRTRDVDENEFLFCYDVARGKNKDVYLVDLPVTQTLENLSNNLSFRQKLSHLLSLYFMKSSVEEVEEILCAQREKYMLEEIVRRECPLNQLERNGLLVAGYSHALNYQRAQKEASKYACRKTTTDILRGEHEHNEESFIKASCRETYFRELDKVLLGKHDEGS